MNFIYLSCFFAAAATLGWTLHWGITRRRLEETTAELLHWYQERGEALNMVPPIGDNGSDEDE